MESNKEKLGFRFKTPASNLLRFWVDVMSEQVEEELEKGVMEGEEK